jgi:hypothetical protein
MGWREERRAWHTVHHTTIHAQLYSEYYIFQNPDSPRQGSGSADLPLFMDGTTIPGFTEHKIFIFKVVHVMNE